MNTVVPSNDDVVAKHASGTEEFTDALENQIQQSGR